MKEDQGKRYEACFELYKKYAGRKLSQIEREMRILGFADFHRRILYGRKENGTWKPGWIEKFGWQAHLKAAQNGSPPYEGGVDALAFCGQTGWFSRPPQQVDAIDVESAARREPPRRQKTPTPLLRKEGSFESWLKQVSPNYNWNWKHQQYIYRHLERITSGENKRLMIFLPPRHGKSELVTVRYAGWRLWNDPAMRIIVSSYNQKLADRFSRSIRKLLSEEEDKQVLSADRTSGSVPPAVAGGAFPSGAKDPPATAGGTDLSELRTPPSALRIFPKTRTINTTSQWETALGGGVKAVGVGAGVTGCGAQLVIIDDPVKNRAEAESETYRERVWDWYRNDLYTRLEPNGSIVLIQTRWHEDDLAGRLLKEMHNGGDQWEVVNLPALAESGGVKEGRSRGVQKIHGIVSSAPSDVVASSTPPLPDSRDPLGRPVGTALCPERFDKNALEEIRRQLGGYAFSALYQQRPTPAEGGIFKRAWFTKFVDRAPNNLKWKRGYDLAVSTKTTSCYTSSFRVAYDASGNMYIADGFRQRLEFPNQRRYIVSRLVSEKDTEHGIEKALHGQAIIQDLRRDPSIRGSVLRGVTVTTDKLTRALKWRPWPKKARSSWSAVPGTRPSWTRSATFPAANTTIRSTPSAWPSRCLKIKVASCLHSDSSFLLIPLILWSS